MNGPHVRVIVQVDRYQTERDFEFIVPINDRTARETFQVLDEPLDRDSAFICTPPNTIANVKRDRVALAQQIAAQIVDFIAKKDLQNGYKKET